MTERVWHQADVEQFHRAMGHPARDWPVFIITDQIQQELMDRADWLIEEAEELKEAAQERNIVKALDALTDSEYFAVGGYVVLGHNGQRFWEHVQDANMAKLGPDGKPVPHPTIPRKIGKPEGWVPPEARHEQYLEDLRHESNLDALALQLAFSVSQDSDNLVELPVVSGGDLLEATTRAYRMIRAVSPKEIERRYRVMASESVEVEEVAE